MSRAAKRIRVLHLIDSLDLGGAQTAILAWLQVHDRDRFEVRLASIHGSPKSLFYGRACNLKIPVILLSPRRWLPLYLFRLPLELAIGRYDIVHCHLFASNWLGKPLARFFGVPIVVAHDHCNDSFRTESTFVQWIDSLANRFADQIFAVSASIRDYLVKFEKIPSERIRVVLNGVPERPLIARRDCSAKLIGGAGRLVPQKNFERFLRIAQILQKIDSSYRFVIAGSGPLEQMLRNKALELGVSVEWLGAQPSLDEFFSSIDLFLLTSDFEGLPMTVLEALQCGVPAAAMAVDGIREEFRDEIALLDPTSSELENGRQIHALLQDPKELSAQIQRGIELISDRFSARTLIGQIEHDYLELLARKEKASHGGHEGE
jgi:glycosyltransferase involved in cell wall biosynthesis